MNTDIHSSQIIFYGNRSNSIAEQKGNLGLAYPCTKFFIPQMQNTIANRDTLLKKLDFILSKKLSLVLSPAGYGKTTMLSSWIYKRDYKSNVLWITLDTRDDSLYSFWHCIIFGLYKQMDSCFEDCMNLFYAYSLYPIESIVNLLINSLAKVNNDILIVLDDFHYIQNIDILSSMKSFINRIPRNTHIILVSRYMPDIPISKLIIQDEVIELTIDDLKLSIDEIGDLLNNRLNLCLNDLEIKDLYCHTEGWITPIKLVADSLMKNPERRGIIEHLNSSYKCLDDFLFDEILNEYPAEVQHFLLKTSILETLNPALCNYILNMDNTGKILVNLMNNHLFIFSLDSNEENFRYHSLFAEILRKRLSSKYPDLIEELYLKASKWCEDNDNIHDAISYSIKSCNDKNSLRLIEAFGEKILYGSDYFKFIEYIDALPDSILTNPVVLLRYAIAYANTRNITILEAILKKKGINIDDDIYSEYKGEFLGIRAIIYLNEGDYAKAEEYSQKAIDLTSPESKFLGNVYYNASCIQTILNRLNRANEYMDQAILLSEKYNDYNLLTMAISHKALILLLSLKTSDSYTLLTRALNYISAENEAMLSASALIYLGLGSLYYEFNDLNKALHYINKALESAIIRNDIASIALAYMCLSNIYCARKEKDKAIEYLKLAEGSFNRDTVRLSTLQHFMSLVKLAIALDDFNYAEMILKKCDDLTPPNLKFFYYFPQTELMIAQKKYTESISMIEKLEKIDFGEMNSIFSTYINNLYALSYHGLKMPKRSRQYIRKVLEICQEAGFIRTPVDYGIAMYELLNDFVKVESRSDNRDENAIGYAKLLLSHFDIESISKKALSNPEGCLTGREIEILKCLASGATNQEIADELYLSPNTVKKHIKNIFDKLNVKNRIQAVELSKHLDLI